MGPDQLSSVMQSVSGKRNPDQSDTRKAELKAKIESQTTALYSTARIWVGSTALKTRNVRSRVDGRTTESSIRPRQGTCWLWAWNLLPRRKRQERQQVPVEGARLVRMAMQAIGECLGCKDGQKNEKAKDAVTKDIPSRRARWLWSACAGRVDSSRWNITRQVFVLLLSCEQVAVGPTGRSRGTGSDSLTLYRCM